MLVQDVLPPQKMRRAVQKEIRQMRKKIKRLSPLVRFCIFALLLLASSFQVRYALAARCATPVISPAAGDYTSSVTVSITDGTSGAVICYTTNGNTPTATTAGTCSAGSTTYSGSFTLTGSATVKALATKSGNTNSFLATSAFVVYAADPTYNPPAGTYSETQYVTISTATSGATICYTTNGTTPAASAGTCTTGSTYSGQITVAATTTIKSLASKSGCTNSAVVSATVTIGTVSSDALLSALAVSSGTLSPVFASGTDAYTVDDANNSSLTVTPTANESHASITVNGTAVTSGSASQAIPLDAGKNTLTIIVTAEDATTTKTYTITLTRIKPPSGVSISGGGMMMY
jgi:hypothetical protein